MKNKFYPHLFEPLADRHDAAAQPHRHGADRHQLRPTPTARSTSASSPTTRKSPKAAAASSSSAPPRRTEPPGRPTVTCLAADEDPLIPGPGQSGRGHAPPRRQMRRADPASRAAGGLAAQEPDVRQRQRGGPARLGRARGDLCRKHGARQIHPRHDRRGDLRPGREIRRGGLAGAAGRLRLGGTPRRARLPDRPVHEPVCQQAQRPLRRQLHQPHAVRARDHQPHPDQMRHAISPSASATRAKNGSKGRARSRKASGSPSCMEEHGAGLSSISARASSKSPGTVMDPMYYPEGWNTYAAAEVKKHVKIPVITSHSLRNPDYCETDPGRRQGGPGRAFRRQMIADPYWANKAQAGKPEEIRRCISCLVGCWQESLMIKRDMRCAINPAVGDERFIHLPPARQACQRGGRRRRARRAWRRPASPRCAGTR